MVLFVLLLNDLISSYSRIRNLPVQEGQDWSYSCNSRKISNGESTEVDFCPFYSFQIETKKGNCCHVHILTEFSLFLPLRVPGRKPPGSLPFPQTLPFPAAGKNGSGSASVSWLGVLGILLESLFGISCGNLKELGKFMYKFVSGEGQ